MLEKVLGLVDKGTIKELETLLQELKKYYTELNETYSIKGDLVELSDKRTSLGKKLDLELIKHDQAIKELTDSFKSSSSKLSEDLGKLESHLSEVTGLKETLKEISTLLNSELSTGEKYQNVLLETLNIEKIQEIIGLQNNIKKSYEDLFKKNEDNNTIEDEIYSLHEELEDKYSKITKIEEEINASLKSTNSITTELGNLYNDWVKGETKTDKDGLVIEIQPRFDILKTQRTELMKFYEKIFGTEDKQGLEIKLEEQLINLKAIEVEAKKVIDLSSDAGLGGGFHQRAKDAKINKWGSVFIFISVLLLLFFFNKDIVGKVSTMTISMLGIRILFNAPLIWIAIVANINLNKYARLEEEYAHKESLAKSFEKYKDQIKDLEDKDSKELMVTLLSTNIEAFRRNPADSIKDAKSDMPIDIISKVGKETLSS